MGRGRGGVKASPTCPRSVFERPAAEDYSRVCPPAPEELPLVPTDSPFPPAIESRGAPPPPQTTPSPPPPHHPHPPPPPLQSHAGLFEAAPRRSACVVLTASGTQAAGRNIQPACEVSEKGRRAWRREEQGPGFVWWGCFVGFNCHF